MIANPLLDAADLGFQQEVRAFLGRELEPRATAIEQQSDWNALRAAVRALGEAGYLRLMFRDLYRGPLPAPGLTHATLLSEEAAYLNYAFESTIATALSCAYALHRHAAAALRTRYLDSLIDGRTIGAICVTEPAAGSDTSRIETRVAFDTARNEWVIDGIKRYISNASVADCYIVYGVSAPASERERISAVLVPATAPGMRFPRLYHFMGRRGCVVGEVEFRNCRVPADHLIGERGAGLAIMFGMFNFERTLLGGSGLGLARSAFDIACAHAQQREAFGRKLAAKQLVWEQVAQMSCRIDAAALLTYRAAKLYDAGLSGKALMKEAAMAKLIASECANHCADAAVQILGGDGLTREYGRVEQLYRDARALRIVGGTSEMAKYVIARRDLPDVALDL